LVAKDDSLDVGIEDARAPIPVPSFQGSNTVVMPASIAAAP
jgi:hypothetical protein